MESLMERYLSGEPMTPDRMSQLDAWLLESDENRLELARLAAVDSVVSGAVRVREATSDASGVLRRQRWKHLIGAISGVAALLAIGFGLWQLAPGTAGGELGAVVAHSSGSDAGGPIRLGRELRTGDVFEIEAGLVELRTEENASVLIEGPASLVVTGANALRLNSGRLSAVVGPEAVGFRVETPVATVIDLGTEFAVVVGDDGETRVEVLEGLVSVGDERVRAGEGLTIRSDGGTTGVRASSPSSSLVRRFPRPGYVSRVIGLRPAYYHRFDAASVTHNLLSWGEYPLVPGRGARILGEGPTLAGGVQNSSLEFGGSAEPAEVIAGATPALWSEAYSVAFWLRVDELAAQSVLCGAANQGPEQSFNLRLGMLEDGRLWASCGLRGEDDGSPIENTLGDDHGEYMKIPEAFVEATTSEPLSAGGWHHVVVGASSGGELRLFVDGEPAASEPIPGRIEVRHERLLLGAIPETELYGRAAPALRGSLDEVAFFDRVLSETEVAAQFTAVKNESD